MNSMEGEQTTSDVVLNWRSTKDSTGPRSAVEREKWDKTIWIGCSAETGTKQGFFRYVPGRVLDSLSCG